MGGGRRKQSQRLVGEGLCHQVEVGAHWRLLLQVPLAAAEQGWKEGAAAIEEAQSWARAMKGVRSPLILDSFEGKLWCAG